MEYLVQTLLDVVGALDYWGVFFLMVIESSFIPFPSELVIPPAAYLASQGQMSLFLVIFFGTLGSLVGALINYFLALHLGKPLVYSLVGQKWAKFLLLSESKLKKAEGYFLKYGSLSTFVGRLIPGIRQLISLPAGFVKMDLWKFSLFTTLGAGIWITALSLLGYLLGANWNFEVYYYVKAGALGLGVLLFFVGVYVFRKR